MGRSTIGQPEFCAELILIWPINFMIWSRVNAHMEVPGESGNRRSEMTRAREAVDNFLSDEVGLFLRKHMAD